MSFLLNMPTVKEANFALLLAGEGGVRAQQQEVRCVRVYVHVHVCDIIRQLRLFSLFSVDEQKVEHLEILRPIPSSGSFTVTTVLTVGYLRETSESCMIQLRYTAAIQDRSCPRPTRDWGFPLCRLKSQAGTTSAQRVY